MTQTVVTCPKCGVQSYADGPARHALTCSGEAPVGMREMLTSACEHDWDFMATPNGLKINCTRCARVDQLLDGKWVTIETAIDLKEFDAEYRRRREWTNESSGIHYRAKPEAAVETCGIADALVPRLHKRDRDMAWFQHSRLKVRPPEDGWTRTHTAHMREGDCGGRTHRRASDPSPEVKATAATPPASPGPNQNPPIHVSDGMLEIARRTASGQGWAEADDLAEWSHDISCIYSAMASKRREERGQ